MAHHHDKLFASLAKELTELGGHPRLSTLAMTWRIGLIESRCRDVLREMILMVRETRQFAQVSVISALTVPERMFSRIAEHRELFSRSPDEAVSVAADLALRYDESLAAIARLKKLGRQGFASQLAAKGRELVSNELARRSAVASADMTVALWRAAGMSWARFLETLREMRATTLEQYSRLEGQHPGVDAAISAIHSADLEDA